MTGDTVTVTVAEMAQLKAELGVAKAELGVAKAELGVAKATAAKVPKLEEDNTKLEEKNTKMYSRIASVAFRYRARVGADHHFNTFYVPFLAELEEAYGGGSTTWRQFNNALNSLPQER